MTDKIVRPTLKPRKRRGSPNCRTWRICGKCESINVALAVGRSSRRTLYHGMPPNTAVFTQNRSSVKMDHPHERIRWFRDGGRGRGRIGASSPSFWPGCFAFRCANNSRRWAHRLSSPSSRGLVATVPMLAHLLAAGEFQLADAAATSRASRMAGARNVSDGERSAIRDGRNAWPALVKNCCFAASANQAWQNGRRRSSACCSTSFLFGLAHALSKLYFVFAVAVGAFLGWLALDIQRPRRADGRPRLVRFPGARVPFTKAPIARARKPASDHPNPAEQKRSLPDERIHRSLKRSAATNCTAPA